jgi:hypothetical protein
MLLGVCYGTQLRYTVVRNFTNLRLRINSLKMQAENSYKTLVNLYHFARNYNRALSGTCLQIFARPISQIFRVQFGVHFSFCY